ncbi:AraC family transcriptional regulator [Mycobacterium sp. 1081908.1]|uniref:AraC family transcriptional regulator n=1 Tax=Mycobacterium sp. 1081908.1 TaxID=1834066 RepID=UPI0009EE2496|nr:AraC family transcriptional regulator [Mycobacterium sp. 1081908.1]
MGMVANDPVADIVADVVATTRRGSLMYSRNRFHAPWGAAFPAADMVNFHVITAGACWLTLEGAEPVQLTSGDVVLISSGKAHVLSDTPQRPARPMSEIAGRTLDEGTPPCHVVIEGDGPATVFICGGYRLATGIRHPLTSVLPEVVLMTAGQARGSGLAAAVLLIAAEVDGTDPGAPAVMASLVDLLFVYLLRTWFAEHHHDSGWGRALFDPTVGTALSLIHADPGRAWTLDTLAHATGTARATLTRRFAALTGQSPMAYVAAWRMSLAARRLRDDNATIRQIAQNIGYDSEFAFARAFKRATGTAPGQYRKLTNLTHNASQRR